MQERWERAHALQRYRPKYPHEEVVRWAFRNLGRAKPPQKVLDHGCGAGRHAIFLAAEGFDAYACDISSTGLQHLGVAADHLRLNVSTHQCHGFDLSHWESGFFDAVVSFGVLYYMTLQEAKEAVREIHRVMKTGGKLFCVLRTAEDSRLKYSTKLGPCTWHIGSLGNNAPSDMEAGCELLFFSKVELVELLSPFEGTIEINRMTCTHSEFTDDDWIIYAVKGQTSK
jgi:SAM-dependent methyltransferase